MPGTDSDTFSRNMFTVFTILEGAGVKPGLNEAKPAI
jgi:hypothetical protein